ncbi:cyclic peptide transporter [Rhodanobacter sp. MP1X3]|nr:cyclic peptide transporter [Rhodanobacter sp. MP1X3]
MQSALEFVSVLVLMVAINFSSQLMLSRLGAVAFMRLRDQLVQGISRLTSLQMERIGRPKLFTAITKDVPAVNDLIIVLPNYVFNVAVVVSCLVYLALVSTLLLVALVVFLGVALAVAKFGIAERGRRRFEIRRHAEDELFRCYQAIIDGSTELKFNRRRQEQFVKQEVQEHAEKYRDATLAAELYWNISRNWTTASIFAGLAGLLFISSLIGIGAGSQVISTFVMVIFYLLGPLATIMDSSRFTQAARLGIQRLDALHLDVTSKESADLTAIARPFQSLSVRGLTFCYEKTDGHRERFSVGPLDLDIYRGELVYLVGGNGSGKTTAAKVLSGLYTKQSGTVLVNGIEVIDQEAYLQYFSAIFQDYYLFEHLIPKRGQELDERAVAIWVEKLNLTDKVRVENGRLSTTSLSYGQRKRLALLVAFFEDSDIYVFDEWAADQDQEFREFFYAEFLPELKRLGKTVLAISHDDRYFHLADKLMKFDGGVIVSTTHPMAERRAIDADPIRAKV